MKKIMLITLLVSPLLTSITSAEENLVFSCSYDSVYWTGRGKSVETNGGIFTSTIKENIIVIKSSSPEVSGSHNLTIKKNSGMRLFATNGSMQFIYNKLTHEYTINTGIGPSGFSVSGGGHMGRQVRVAGKCSDNQE
ncbi:MAG: hypothetical protein ACI89Z_000627 [Porticoccus sp.]|jgi:hypothetical protein